MLSSLPWIAALSAVAVLGCDLSDGEYLFAADIQYFLDANCTVASTFNCAYTDKLPSGSYQCVQPVNNPNQNPFYASLVQTSNFSDVQVVFTRDRSCPPGGADAVVATLSTIGDCVEIAASPSEVGLTIYPDGGSNLGRRNVPGQLTRVKRDGSCTGFNIASQEDSYTPSQQVSSIVSCSPGGNPCTISEGTQNTTSVATMYSITAGGSIGFGGDMATFSATFGQTYTQSETTTLQSTYNVSPGQKGYLSVYSAATLFKGTFTGCSSGNSEQDGEVLAVKKNSLTYMIVYTSD